MFRHPAIESRAGEAEFVGGPADIPIVLLDRSLDQESFHALKVEVRRGARTGQLRRPKKEVPRL
jgi:hypothetical protein